MKFALFLIFILISGCSNKKLYRVRPNEALYIAIGSQSGNFDSLKEGVNGALEVGGQKWGKLEIFVDDRFVEKVEDGFFIGPVLNRDHKKGSKILIKGESDKNIYLGLQLIEYEGVNPISSKIIKLHKIGDGRIFYEINLGTLR